MRCKHICCFLENTGDIGRNIDFDTDIYGRIQVRSATRDNDKEFCGHGKIDEALGSKVTLQRHLLVGNGVATRTSMAYCGNTCLRSGRWNQ